MDQQAVLVSRLLWVLSISGRHQSQRQWRCDCVNKRTGMGQGVRAWKVAAGSSPDQGFQGAGHIVLAHQRFAHQHRIGAGALHAVEIVTREQA